jgi:hypothetical protein
MQLFPETKVWNIAQLDKALRYITVRSLVGLLGPL